MSDVITVKLPHTGQEYPLDVAKLTAWDAVIVRREAGVRLADVINGGWLVGEDASLSDLDFIAVFVWLSRVKSGEQVTFREVAESMTYHDFGAGMIVDAPDGLEAVGDNGATPG